MCLATFWICVCTGVYIDKFASRMQLCLCMISRVLECVEVALTRWHQSSFLRMHLLFMRGEGGAARPPLSPPTCMHPLATSGKLCSLGASVFRVAESVIRAPNFARC